MQKVAFRLEALELQVKQLLKLSQEPAAEAHAADLPEESAAEVHAAELPKEAATEVHAAELPRVSAAVVVALPRGPISGMLLVGDPGIDSICCVHRLAGCVRPFGHRGFCRGANAELLLTG
jgi:hypothetical protein